MTKEQQAWFGSLPDAVRRSLAQMGMEAHRTTHITHVTSSGPEYVYCRPVLIHHLTLSLGRVKYSANPYIGDYVLVEGFGLSEKFPTDRDLDVEEAGNG